ncbi:MAG: carboxypeptidase regulatory-like domain-containing protein [Gammaproteobacteria bacterium]|nr:carboxypeptidase regulatory-like domain-containing protein [Gammaproteobacteria bacterium]
MWRIHLLIVGLSAFSLSSNATDLAGTVEELSGKPASGTFVTAELNGRAMSVSVVTDAEGRYAIPALFAGEYTLSATKIGFEKSETVNFTLSEEGARHDFVLAATDNPAAQLPGNTWLAALPEGSYKARFVTGCTICHDIGAEPIRRRRSREEWIAAIKLMREGLDIYSVIPNIDNAELADWLLAHEFGERPAAIAQPDPGQDATANLVITRYEVGDVNSWAHDMIIEPATGAAWVGDYPDDKLIRVDPRTGIQRSYQLPVTGSGMHTLHFDAKGFLWITLQLADMVARFDPRTEQFRIYGGFQQGSLVHSFAYDEFGLVQFDSEGRMWMSEFGTNAVASLNPDTGEVKEYKLLGNTGHTYGIALDSKKRVWFTKSTENKFGYLDPKNGRVTEKEMPRPDSAPHRMDVDRQDRLWIPNSGYGTLAMYDIGSGNLREIPLPDPDTFPYAARFDGATGTVWITGNGANSLYRFDPETETFDTYRIPAAQAYGRMIAIDYSTGDVWTALSNYPNKHTGRNTGTLVRLQGVARPTRRE